MHARELTLDLDPWSLFRALASKERPFFIDAGQPWGEEWVSSMGFRPRMQFRVTAADPADAPLARLEAACAAIAPPAPRSPPAAARAVRGRRRRGARLRSPPCDRAHAFGTGRAAGRAAPRRRRLRCRAVVRSPRRALVARELAPRRRRARRARRRDPRRRRRCGAAAAADRAPGRDLGDHEQPRCRRVRPPRRTHPRVHRRGRRLPGEPHAAIRHPPARSARRGVRAPARDATRALRRLPRSRTGAGALELARALPPAPRRAPRDLPHQGHAPARRERGRRRRARGRARRRPEGARRARHDRRPRAERRGARL